MRTLSTGNLEGSNEVTSIGPFIRPALKFEYNAEALVLAVSYEFQAAGGQSFGATTNNFGKNIFMTHDPIFSLAGNINDRVRTNFLGELYVVQFNGNQAAENWTDFIVNPDLEYIVSPQFSFLLGYVFDRITRPDDVIGPSRSSSKSLANKNIRDMNEEDFNQALKLAGTEGAKGAASPKKDVHAIMATAKINFSEKTSLKSYVRSGRLLSNQEGQSGYQHRLNVDFSLEPFKDLSFNLRYRFNSDILDIGDLKYYHRGRVIAGYALSSRWSINLENDFFAFQSTITKDKANYWNENYVGTTYTF
jgi:hypothetical protein